MRMRIVFVAILCLVVFAVVRRAGAAGAGDMPKAGQQAPDFTLPSQDGKPVSLHQFRGKWVVLYFYPKDMTSGCTMEAHNFQRDQAQYDGLNAAVVGVSVDTPDSHKTFCTKEGLTFKLLSDKDKQVVKLYDSQIPVIGIAARNTFLIDPTGKIVKVWTKVDPSGHSDEVIAEIKKDEHKG